MPAQPCSSDLGALLHVRVPPSPLFAAYSLQFKSRAELAADGFSEDCPYDQGYTVVPPPL